MPYVPYKKGTLLIPTGGTKHLFAIITDACPEGKHLLVNVSKISPVRRHDPTCVFAAGAHPFIKQPSFAYFQMAQIQKAARLSKMVDLCEYSDHRDISDELLAQMRAGIDRSDYTPRYIINYFAGLPVGT